MPAADYGCRKPQRENHAFCFWSHASLSHLDINLLDYIPHKTRAVPLFLALSVSHRICRASHQSILPTSSRCPGHPPTAPRIFPNFRIQSSVCPGGSSVRRNLHSSDPVTRIESDALNFSRHSRMQHFVGIGTNEYG